MVVNTRGGSRSRSASSRPTRTPTASTRGAPLTGMAVRGSAVPGAAGLTPIAERPFAPLAPSPGFQSPLDGGVNGGINAAPRPNVGETGSFGPPPSIPPVMQQVDPSISRQTTFVPPPVPQAQASGIFNSIRHRLGSDPLQRGEVAKPPTLLQSGTSGDRGRTGYYNM